MLHSYTGYLSGQSSTIPDTTGREYAAQAEQAYEEAFSNYQNTLSTYKTVTRDSATSTLNAYFSASYDTVKGLSDALALSQKSIAFISRNDPAYQPAAGAVAQKNLSAWSDQITTDLVNITAAKNQLNTASNSLHALQSGPNSLDVEAQRNLVIQKGRDYGRYFIRAPYDGTVGKVTVSSHDQVAAGDLIASFYNPQETVVTSLNEVDAAKVRPGLPAAITFDAINGLMATGTVSDVDQIGTATQGVVYFNVTTSISTKDPRIKPGMSSNLVITTHQKPGVIIIPTGAIKKTGSVNYVLVMDPRALQRNAPASSTISTAATPLPKQVILGESDDTNTEITAGLHPGEYVVLRLIAPQKKTALQPALSRP